MNNAALYKEIACKPSMTLVYPDHHQHNGLLTPPSSNPATSRSISHEPEQPSEKTFEEVRFCGPQGLVFPDSKLLPLPRYLEEVTLLFLQACNIRDKDILRTIVDRYVTPTFDVIKAESFQAVSRDNYVRGKVAMWAESPDFRLYPRNTTAFVEERKGKALVFSTNSLIGTVRARPELTREEVTVNHFRQQKNGEWICTKFQTVRGPGRWTFESGHDD